MKILVVDDEPLARERLLRLLGELKPAAQCFEAANGDEALAVAARELPDLLLLDIRMPGMDGLEVAAHLGRLVSPPALVFCTAFDEYALDALQHQAVAYLLKPVREADLARALASAGRVNRVQLAELQSASSSQAGRPRRSVSSQTHRGFETVPVAEVRCFLAEQKYVTAHTPGGELLIPDTLKELEREFADSFVRVHRNALVSLAHLLRLERLGDQGWRARLEGVSVSPAVSRRHLANVKKRLGER